MPFGRVLLSPIESKTFSLLKHKELYVDGTPDHWTNSKTITYKLYQGASWINCKTNASTGKVKQSCKISWKKWPTYKKFR